MKEGARAFNPFEGKKSGKEDEGRGKSMRKKSRRRKGARMMMGRK